MNREHTNEEMRQLFLDHVRGVADYWANLPNVTPKEAAEGVAFSIMVALDGESVLPAYELIPSPHPDDKAFSKAADINYYPEPSLENNIAGTLHERLFRKELEGKTV